MYTPVWGGAYCAVPENIHTHPMEGQWKFQGGGGGLKSQTFRRNVWGLTGNSRGVGGLKPKSLPWEGYGYFLELHIVKVKYMCLIPRTQHKVDSTMPPIFLVDPKINFLSFIPV